MATVRITKDLTEAVTTNARRKFEAQLEAAQTSAPTEWGDIIYDRIFSGYIPTMEKLPESFFPMESSMTITRVGEHQTSLTLGFSTPKRWPMSFPIGVPADKGHYGDYVRLNTDPLWTDFEEAVVAWKGRVAAVEKQRDEFVAGVQQVLASFTTLAPALKAWPPLWELVPESYKDKHKEIVERKKPTAATLDTTKLTAVLAASKIGAL